VTQPPLKGRELQAAIVDLARRLGWRVAHTPPVETTRGWRTPTLGREGKGFPDLLLVRDRVIVAEVKGTDRLTAEQKKWLTAFRMAGIAAHVWTPKEWASGEIERILSARKQQAYAVGGLLPPTPEYARMEGGLHAAATAPTAGRLQHNPEPLRVTKSARCTKCHRDARSCSCYAPEFDYPE
jgi:hypothetical protein